MRVAFVTAISAIVLAMSGCNSDPDVTSGRIVDIVKHDDVERKEKVCVSKSTERYKKSGKTRTRQICVKYKTVKREVSTEWYEFQLKNGNKTGWVSVDETTGESYKEGDQYP